MPGVPRCPLCNSPIPEGLVSPYHSIDLKEMIGYLERINSTNNKLYLWLIQQCDKHAGDPGQATSN